MKNKFRNIAATVLSLIIASPFALRAEHRNTPVSVDTENLNQDYFNQANQLLSLDEEAIEELEALGYELEDADDELAQSIIAYAAKYLGTPYVYGSRGPKTFDCSGFTSYVFREYGINLHRTSRDQATQGTKVDVKDIRPGDLLFFGGRGGGKTVGHVALAVDVDDNGSVKFIHASVSKGITYNTYPNDSYYNKRFLGARRVIEE